MKGKNNMFKRKKKSHFSDIIFTDKYYYNGVDILDDANREKIKTLDIELGFRVSFNKLNNSTMYQVKGKTHKFNLVISKVRDFKIVSFMNVWEFNKACKNIVLSQQSSKLNKMLQRDLAIKMVKDSVKPENEVYSKSYSKKAIIKDIANSFQVEYYILLSEDPQNFHFYDDISKENFYYWEKMSGVSYFKALEDAKREIDVELKKLVGELDIIPDVKSVSEKLLEECTSMKTNTSSDRKTQKGTSGKRKKG